MNDNANPTEVAYVLSVLKVEYTVIINNHHKLTADLASWFLLLREYVDDIILSFKREIHTCFWLIGYPSYFM